MSTGSAWYRCGLHGTGHPDYIEKQAMKMDFWIRNLRVTRLDRIRCPNTIID